MNRTSKLLLLFLLMLSLTASGQYNYDAQWKKIQANSKSGGFKSNLQLVADIRNHAMNDKNMVELARALRAEYNLRHAVEDDAQNDFDNRFFARLGQMEKEFKGKDQLLFRMLESEFVRSYYDRNRWQINRRTNLESDDLSKIETWSRLDFKNYLRKIYKELLSADLENVALAPYRKIFSDADNIDYFPTLREWVTLQEIEFLSDRQLFTPNELKENTAEVDRAFSKLISQNNGNARLYFKHRKLNHDCAQTNCKDKLQQLIKLYQSDETGDYKVMIATEIVDELTAKERYTDALQWIARVKQEFPKSTFLNNIKNREAGIINPSLTLHFERQTLSARPIQIVAEHKNLPKFELKIYRTDEPAAFFEFVRNSDIDNEQKLKRKFFRTETFGLPKTSDYKTHKTAVAAGALPPGLYIVDYIVNDSVQDSYPIIAGNRRIVFQNKDKSGSERLLLIDSDTGEALGSQNLEIWENIGGNKSVKKTVTTDSDGSFQIESGEKRYSRDYLIKAPGNQYTLTSHYGYYGESSGDDKIKKQAQIFIDRGIYRPGQVLYFKVVNTQLQGAQENVVTQLKQKITLYDANGQELSAQDFTTNEFGSYHGSFTLPQGQLNGNFSLRIKDGNLSAYKSFRVEEYKRPKFEVSFEPIKGEYHYGQTLEVKGSAKAFSGVPLSNARVMYEIKKRNIRWRYFSWLPESDDNENSILGEVIADEQGNFTIKVELKKDETREGIQIDNYEITASVTDVNGETQSADTQVRVASVSHYLQIKETEADYYTDESVLVKAEAKNYNDQELKKTATVRLSKLTEPERIFRQTFESAVQDLPLMTKADFVSKFPHDRFDKNDLKPAVEKVVSQRSQETGKDIDLGKLPAGTYRLEVFNIEGKDSIRTEQEFRVWNRDGLSPEQKPFLRVVAPRTQVKQGEKIQVYIYSAVPKALLRIYVQNGNGRTRTETRTFKNGKTIYEFVAPKDDGISAIDLQFQLAAFNDVETRRIVIEIESARKPLRIETVTFRDRIEPGAKEKWSVKVLGDDKEKVNAEVLANMYDQSLDQFVANRFNWSKLYTRPYSIRGYGIDRSLQSEYYARRMQLLEEQAIVPLSFDWMDNSLLYGGGRKYAFRKMMAAEVTSGRVAGIENQVYDSQIVPEPKLAPRTEAAPESLEKIPVRQNLNETAFFYPNLKTDKDGNVEFEFTSPEALTRWKLMFLAHTKDARAAVLEKQVVTQKEFSVTPNYPRFLREGDQIVFQSKLSSLADRALQGRAMLQILDATTMADVTERFEVGPTTQSFGQNPQSGTSVSWQLKAPKNLSSVILKVVATAGSFSDGEQQAIAILPNRVLVTDAVPVFVKEGQTKTFTLDNLLNNNSSTVTNVRTSLELTTNPIWDVIFALPSLKTDANSSADVIFNKWFADVLASEIIKVNPRIKAVFDEYNKKGLLASNLERNQELKQILLEETPWVLDSQSENEQMQKVARLFDLNNMRTEVQSDWQELQKLQNPDGGFSWYPGYPSSYSVSLYILKQLGKLNEWLKGDTADYTLSAQKQLTTKLISYVDTELNRHWDVKKDRPWSNYALDYLDTRRYWEKQAPLTNNGAALKSSVMAAAKRADIRDFTFFGLHRAALLFDAYSQKEVSARLLRYLKETAVQSETQGAYWKQNLNDWGWYSTKTVNHAGAVEAFSKLQPQDENFIEELKIWLVTQKEVSSWPTSRSTAEVIFTLLNSGKSWTTPESDKAEITWAGKRVDGVAGTESTPSPMEKAGVRSTGYIKETVVSDKIDKSLAKLTVKKDGSGIVQGGLFWQYYEDLDKIKSSETYVSISKELYRKVKTENGEQLQKITPSTPLKVGDRVTVRMILNTDRNMGFVHLKDMRAAGFEPLDVLSGYQWKNGLGYYQSTKDASTNFYIRQMPKGRYVFEYDLICNAAGTFSNGISTLQNYYAPQMNSHTVGSTVRIAQ